MNEKEVKLDSVEKHITYQWQELLNENGLKEQVPTNGVDCINVDMSSCQLGLLSCNQLIKVISQQKIGELHVHSNRFDQDMFLQIMKHISQKEKETWEKIVMDYIQIDEEMMEEFEPIVHKVSGMKGIEFVGTTE